MGRSRKALAAALVAIAILTGTARGADPAPDPSKLSSPVAIVAGGDGDLWIADALGVMRMTPTGAYTRVVEAPRVTAVAAGPDGAIWFAEYEPARIGRIDPDGRVDYFSQGIGGGVVGIAAGPDGNLWFTDQGAARVGRITPAGEVAEVSDGLLPRAQLEGIVAGPDGNMWFSDFNERVGRVTMRGAIREFALPHSLYGGPSQIALGGDGRLWGTWADGRVVRVTTRGRARFFRTPFDLLYGITPGPDGSVWLAGQDSSGLSSAHIARVTPDGRARVVGDRVSGLGTSAITSAGGHLWAAEYPRELRNGYRVVRYSVDGAASELPGPPPCRVPSVQRRPLPRVRLVMFRSLCRLDTASRRAGRARGAVALRVRPAAGSELPFDARVHVRFGPAPPLPRHCRLPFAGRMVARTHDVLVFSYRTYDGYEGDVNTHYGACLRPRGRPRMMVTAHEELLIYEEARAFQVSGPFVAYRFEDEDHYGNTSLELRVFDVRRGHQSFYRTVEWHEGNEPPGPPETGESALSRHGAIAWVKWPGGDARLYAHGPRSGGVKLLDRNAQISDLRFAGDVLSWTAGSTVKSATVR